MAVLKKKNQAVQKIVKKTPAPATKQASGGMKSSGTYIATVGRRKTSIARVRLYTGSGDNMINDKSVS